jgi:uncharacterized protein (DUF608 family)
MKLYRDWQLSGDDAMLQKLWPRARKALEFCWIPGGWDADRDGVMEGCQHNTMDVEYYGPNPEIGVWYLGALRAAEEMARAVGDKAFAGKCRGLFERGSRWLDEHLFNGEFYEHEIRPPAPGTLIAEGLRVSTEDPYAAEPRYQIGAGCLADQLVGQLMAHVCGLGYLLDPAHVRAALRSIMKYNYRRSMHAHFTHQRTYALADEPGLLVASYPLGRRPKYPFPYASEVWTGIEYTAAAHMLYEAMTADGLKCIAAARARHDGARRNPFDEPECGHHYARAMASWAAVLAFTGFRYSGADGTVEFAKAAKPARCFWSNGRAWGTAAQRPVRGGVRLSLSVLHGALKLRRVVLRGFGSLELTQERTIGAGRTAEFTVAKA